MDKPLHSTPQIVTVGGQRLIGGLSRVYHCNHYNAYLQMAVLMTEYLPQHSPQQLLTEAVTPLIQELRKRGYSQQQLLEEYSYCGFGVLRQIDAIHWETPSSHYGQSLTFHGKPQKSCFFTTGYLQGLLDRQVVEVACQVEGSESDRFQVSELPCIVNPYLVYPLELTPEIPERFSFSGCQEFTTQIDEPSIIAAVNSLPLYGKKEAPETGLIPAFGVVLTHHFADYYNQISYQTYWALRNAGMPEEDSKEMFIQAGHICAFNTFGGIMKSPEWHAIVAPHCRNREDWLHGMIAVINALGWGIFRVERIVPEKEFIVRVYNSYEGIGYRRIFLKTEDKNMSFLGMGATLGLVHLLWKVDIRERPDLTHDFYVKQFNNPQNSYTVEQSHAIAAGDEYDRFIVSK